VTKVVHYAGVYHEYDAELDTSPAGRRTVHHYRAIACGEGAGRNWTEDPARVTCQRLGCVRAAERAAQENARWEAGPVRRSPAKEGGER